MTDRGLIFSSAHAPDTYRVDPSVFVDINTCSHARVYVDTTFNLRPEAIQMSCENNGSHSHQYA